MSANENARANDPVNHPLHYTSGAMETWEAIEGLNLGFHAGNVLKYLSRYKLKGGIQDLHKARAYLNRLIDIEERAALHLKLEAEQKTCRTNCNAPNNANVSKDDKRNAALEAGRQTGKQMVSLIEVMKKISQGIREVLTAYENPTKSKEIG